MKYINFSYYRDQYLGKSITNEDDFFNVCVRAEAYIDKLTNSRINEISDDIKNAVAAVCDVIYKQDKQYGIKSESVDGYSISLDKSESFDKRLYETACLFLPSYLTYRGI